MIFKIVMSSKPDIVVENEAALKKFLEQVQMAQSKLVVTKYGIINPSFIVSIVENEPKNEEVANMLRGRKPEGDKLVAQYTPEQATERALGPSPFARLLSERMGIPPGMRTLAQEEGARGDREARRGG